MQELAYVTKFMNHMDELGEMVFLSGDTHQDAEMIKSRLTNQGFWSGDKYRYFFDEKMDLVKVEERF